jgi:hypothetical protein
MQSKTIFRAVGLGIFTQIASASPAARSSSFLQEAHMIERFGLHPLSQTKGAHGEDASLHLSQKIRKMDTKTPIDTLCKITFHADQKTQKQVTTFRDNGTRYKEEFYNTKGLLKTVNFYDDDGMKVIKVEHFLDTGKAAESVLDKFYYQLGY